MKKLKLTAIAFLLGITISVAQDFSFGLTAGYSNGTAKVESGDFEASASESGFFIGLLADYAVSEKFHVQPELVFNAIDNLSSLVMPIMAKYYATDKLNIQAGPTFSYLLEDSQDDYTNFGLSLGVGMGYDINDKWLVEGRYNFQVNDYYTGDASGVSSKLNLFTLGVGYRFN